MLTLSVDLIVPCTNIIVIQENHACLSFEESFHKRCTELPVHKSDQGKSASKFAFDPNCVLLVGNQNIESDNAQCSYKH